MAKYEAHPLADLFPLIEGAEFDDLCASIKAEGQLDPIVLFEGKVLDGRNRLRACEAVGVEPEFQKMEGSDEDARAYVLARNVCRRSLSTSQRALILAQLQGSGVNTEAMQEQHNVSPRQVAKATSVLRSGDSEVIHLVRSGVATVNRADDVLAGRVPRDALAERYQKRHHGRPSGNSRVNTLRRALDMLIKVADYDKVIASNWPGDPELNEALRVSEKLLRSLSRLTQEADRAAVSA